MSVIAGVRNSRRQVRESSSVEARAFHGSLDESSGIPSRMSSTPNWLREQTDDLKEFSARFDEDFFPGLMGKTAKKPMSFSLTDLTGLDSPLEPVGAVSKGVRRSSRISRKP